MARALIALAFGLCSLAAVGAPVPKGADTVKFEFQPKPVPPTDRKIDLIVAKAVTKDQRGLVLPLKITNASGEAIKTALAHEWHGGLWPLTSLFASVTPVAGEEPLPFAPVYLAGEDPRGEKSVSLAAGKGADVELRMDWKGTGSVKGAPLVQKPGKYVVRFALVFEVDGKPQYAMSAPTEVEYKAE